MRRSILMGSLTVALLMALAIPIALAQETLDIPWNVISGGGEPSTGAGVTLNGTLGQPIIGPSSGGGPGLGAGYWYVQAEGMADLAIEKQALAGSVTAGEELTYAITVTNLGPDAATGVEVLDLVPPGTHVVAITGYNPHSVSEFCSLNGTCDLGLLPSRESGIGLANHTPGQADGSTIARTVTIGPGDLPAAATIADVKVDIEFEKIDHENCGLPYSGGNPYNREIVFYLTSPSGTRVVLVESLNNWGGSGLGATYTSDSYSGGRVTVRFDDAASTLVGGPQPVSGTYRPEQPLTTLIGEDPFGTWTLTAGDDAATDALCLAGFDLEVTAVQDIEATVSLVLSVDPDYAGDVLVNQAQVSADATDLNETNNVATATTAVQAQADLGITKSVLNDELCLGADNLYEIEVTNDGPSDAQDVYVTDVLTDALVYAGGSPQCYYDGAVRCGLERLPAGDSHSFLVNVSLAPDVVGGTWIANTAAVTSATTDPNPTNDTSPEAWFTTVPCLLPEADLSIVKTVLPAQVPPGGLVTYALTVTNAGPLAATSVQLLETIPADTELVSIVADNPDFAYEFCTPAGICYLGTIQPESTIASVTAVLRVDEACEAPSITNIASALGSQADYHPDDNLDWAEVAVVPAADLALDKGATPTANVGGLISYTLAVGNLGPQAAAGVLVTDTLPTGVTLASVDAGCAPAGSAVVCAAPLLEAGQALTFTLAVTVNVDVEPGTSLENAAIAGSSATDPDPSNNADTAATSVLGRTDLVLDKTGPEWVLPNGTVTYTIVATNNGPSMARSVNVEDDLPEGIDLISATVQRTGGDLAPCDGLVCQVGDMAVGEVVIVIVVGQVHGDLPAELVLTNSATVFSDTPEDDLLNNTDDHICWVRHYSVYLPLIERSFPYRRPPRR
jgi:uncharacterized repeat protein (TIGR01451 family)